MTAQAYLLTFLIRLSGSETGTTQQMVSIAADTDEDAVELARFYRAGLPDASVRSATLTDVSGAVIWFEDEGGDLVAEDQR